MASAGALPGASLPPAENVADAELDRLLLALRKLDASARLEPHEGPPRHCTTERCLCRSDAVLNGHIIPFGHASLAKPIDVEKLCARAAATPCACCKRERRLARRSATWPRDNGCPAPSLEVCTEVADAPAAAAKGRTAPKEQRHCHYCGSTKHLMRGCTLGSSTHRSQQFLHCAPGCFVRRFVVPLHHARTNFELDDLCEGRVDLAARLIAAALVCSQRLRHNTEIWLPFLGDKAPTSVCVTGGLVRGLHPSELSNARRLRQAIDALGPGAPEEHTPPPALHPDLRGYRMLRGGFEEVSR